MHTKIYSSNTLTETVSPKPMRPNSTKVLVVVNDNSQASIDIGLYYQSKRLIPNKNIMHYNGDTNEKVPESEYLSLVNKIKEWIINNELQINFIVLTKGTPLISRISYIGDSGTINAPYDFSVCNWIGTINTKREGATIEELQGNPGESNPYSQGGWWLARTSPLNNSPLSGEPFSSTNTYTNLLGNSYSNLYLVTRLDGYTVDDVKKLIDNSINASSNIPYTSKFLFDARTNGDYEHLYNQADMTMINASEHLYSKNYEIILDKTYTFLTGYMDLMGYFSWGSNSNGDYTLSKYQNNYFRPGAIGETFVSTSARTFDKPNGYPNYSGQSLIADLVMNGITGIAGYVSEPTLGACIDAEIIYDRYTKGYTLAESFCAASPTVNWMAVIIGDPLCAPYYIPETNAAPTLENGYVTSELNQETSSTILTFKVKYKDPEYDIPKYGYPKLYIKKDGIEILDSPFTMNYLTGDCISGAIYSYSTTLPIGTNYTYYFEAEDIYGASTILSPTDTQLSNIILLSTIVLGAIILKQITNQQQNINQQQNNNLQEKQNMNSTEKTALAIGAGVVLLYLLKPKCHGIYGDINGTGTINIGDAQRLSQHLLYPTNPSYTLTNCQKIAADVDGDGILTQNDVDIITNYASYGTIVGRITQTF